MFVMMIDLAQNFMQYHADPIHDLEVKKVKIHN